MYLLKLPNGLRSLTFGPDSSYFHKELPGQGNLVSVASSSCCWSSCLSSTFPACKASKAHCSACFLPKYLENHRWDRKLSISCCPQVAYNSAISACEKAGLWRMALLLLETLLASGMADSRSRQVSSRQGAPGNWLKREYPSVHYFWQSILMSQ